MTKNDEVVFHAPEPDLSALPLVAEAVRLTWRTVSAWVPFLAVTVVVATFLPLGMTVLFPFIVGGVIGCLHEERSGHRAHWFSGLGYGVARIVPAVIASFLFGILMWFVMLLSSAAALVPGAGAVALVVVAGVLGAYLCGRYMLAPSVCFLEHGGPVATLVRAREMAQGRIGKLLLAWLTAMVAGAFLSVGTLVPVAYFVNLLLFGLEVAPLRLALYTGLMILHCGFGCLLPLSTQYVAYARIRDAESFSPGTAV